MASVGSHKASSLVAGVLFVVLLPACDDAAPRAPALQAQEALSSETFAGLVHRISEPGGYFDTDNLISNETGYLNVLDALEHRGLRGGAYVGVGPDQNFSYIAQIRPEIAFIVDVRRDNLLHHLLLKALMEGAPTRVEFLARLHGVAVPSDPGSWRERSVVEVVAWVDSAHAQGADDLRRAGIEALQDTLLATVDAMGIPLDAEDRATVRRFHDAFVSAGPALRFTSFGRPPRPYYPTYRQLLTETDIDGDRVSYMASRERYDVVRGLQLANRIIPLVGDLAGPRALRELGRV
ncbi:MAG: hypothetical protein R3304_10855, partial [Longimicrobiales bacterium]|nr:hypothetical protein [Longimicrobiales bacterium]